MQYLVRLYLYGIRNGEVSKFLAKLDIHGLSAKAAKSHVRYPILLQYIRYCKELLQFSSKMLETERTSPRGSMITWTWLVAKFYKNSSLCKWVWGEGQIWFGNFFQRIVQDPEASFPSPRSQELIGFFILSQNLGRFPNNSWECIWEQSPR
jgi:hypothetical protein